MIYAHSIIKPLARPAALCLATVCLAAAATARADDGWPRTRAERTGYRETSSLADVTAFLDALKAKGAPIELRTIGKSAGGRPIVMAVASRPSVADAAAARAAGKLVVYVQANIHGGEVEGKEAAQQLLRDVATDRAGAATLLDKLVLLVVPVYNADGNEALGDGPRTRPSQDGPARVGQRPNGAGLDLNRDAIKAEAPETRAVLEHVYRAWDPALTFDLHTTNGTRHGYLLTYSPPLNPGTEPAVLAYARDALLPGVRERLNREHHWKLLDYGNVETRRGVRGWYTFGDEGRYVTNYLGLRNRLSVLSEAASFQPFETRVGVTLGFIRATLDALARDAGRVRTLLQNADNAVTARGLAPESAPAIPVRTEPEPRGTEPVPLESVAPGTKVDHHKAPASLKDEVLPVFDRFRVTRSARQPAAYAVPATQTRAIELIRRHGIAVERLTADWKGPADRFLVTEANTARQAFQGGQLTRFEGRFEPAEVTLPAGTFLVRTAQPLGPLASYLLEPEGLDGLAAWGFLNDAAGPGPFPVLKLMTTTVPTEPVR